MLRKLPICQCHRNYALLHAKQYNSPCYLYKIMYRCNGQRVVTRNLVSLAAITLLSVLDNADVLNVTIYYVL